MNTIRNYYYLRITFPCYIRYELTCKYTKQTTTKAKLCI